MQGFKGQGGEGAAFRLTGGQVGRMALSLAVGAVMLWLLLGRLSQIEPREVAEAFRALPSLAWAMAALATAVSFAAVGQYDVALHRHFATGIAPRAARRAGVCAIAVSQMIGLGVVSGAILRWRMLPGLTLWQAARLTAAVAVSFLGAWAVVTALVLACLPGAPFRGVAALALVGAGGIALLALVAPPRWAHLPRGPNAVTLVRLFLFCLIDMAAAALAFHALCPPGLAPGFAVLFPAFLLAYGAGLVSGAPGGMGAFEITLLALLPGQPEAPLLAAILAWRLVYFALPAVLGAVVAIRGPGRVAPAITHSGRPTPADALLTAPGAEMQLLRQGALSAIGRTGQGVWLAGRTAHFLCGMIEPAFAARGPGPALAALRRTAREEARLPLLYKATPRLAAHARAAGLAVLPLAREAVIRPRDWRIGSSSLSGLRRKLRRAEGAGVTITGPDVAPDWPALAEVARDWALAHGGERGFSMGRFERGYLGHQRLYTAWAGGRVVAFASFHEGAREWVLDLMRHRVGVPDGTMYLLVATAIEDARRLRLPRLSLAAVPETAFSGRLSRASRLLGALGADGGAGLARFKSAFAPRWEPRYLCLPHAALLPLAALELARAIHRPEALPPPGPARPGAELSGIDQDHAEYAFASAR